MHHLSSVVGSLALAASFALTGLASGTHPALAAAPLVAQRSFAWADTVRSEFVYVANYQANSVTAYPAGASGNVRPSIMLAGPHTRLFEPLALAHDREGRLFVVVTDATLGVGEVLVFARGARGDAAPVRSFRVSSYSSGGVDTPVFPVSLAVDGNGYTYVGDATNVFMDSPTVAAYGPAAAGAAAPLRTFSGGSPFSQPRIAVNDAGQVYVVYPADRNNPPFVQKYSAFAQGNVYLSGRYYSL